MSSPAPSPSRTLRDWFSPPLLWVSAPLTVFTVAFIWRVWPEWTRNPDLSHGWFAPLIFGLLLWEGAQQGTQRWLRPSFAIQASSVLLAILALLLFGAGGLLAATVGWSHAAVNFVLAAALAAAWLGGLLLLSGERVRALPFNWTILTAIGLWLLVAPIPDGTYKRLTLTLQHSVTTGVLDALHMLGIPARQQGNIIELATTSVGVEEACSGIRSLLSCLYAGFFFAGWLVRGAARRAVLILAAPVLAVTMNFIRSLTLTLMANAGTNITGFWHDATGYAILGLTSLLLAGLAHLLSAAPRAVATSAPSAITNPPTRLFATFAGISAVIAAIAIFFASFHYAPPASAPANDNFASLIPDRAEGWQVRTSDDLYRFSALLRTQQLAERTFYRMAPDGPIQITLYVARWSPGAASVSMVASHTPDACWPGNGWVPATVGAQQAALDLGSRTLPIAEQRLFTRGPAPQHVWFWHIYNDHVINYRDPYSVRALFEIAWHYGFRREGSQYFIRFSSNRPWEKIASEPLVQEIFARLAPVGLAQ